MEDTGTVQNIFENGSKTDIHAKNSHYPHLKRYEICECTTTYISNWKMQFIQHVHISRKTLKTAIRQRNKKYLILVRERS